MKIGDKVKFIGCSEDQIKWGGNDDPKQILVIGNTYIVEDVDVHTWHTKLYLKGVCGKYNSVCFETIDGRSKP
jgi:hypothetical protein